jgi:hypothetical protein
MSAAPAHHADDHSGGPDGDHGEGPGEEALGPVDVAAWLAGIAGLAVALVIAYAFVLSTGDL